MASSMDYQCQGCGAFTEVQQALPEFIDHYTCAACGLSAQESDIKLQTELASLFSRNLNLANSGTEGASSIQGPSPKTGNSINYSISQHYHHSAHVAPSKTSSQNSDAGLESLPSSSPQDSVQYTLFQHNIDRSRLSSSQLVFLEQAGPEERARLLGLWRLTLPETSYFGLHELHDNDNDKMETRKEEACSGRLAATPGGEPKQVAEPYIMSGYESLAQRDYEQQANHVYNPLDLSKAYSPLISPMGGQYNRAKDPIYGSKELWYHSMSHQPMEHQYGMFDQMSQSHHQPPNSVGIHGLEDEEML